MARHEEPRTTHPAVHRPDSETHWTCPQAPSPGMTHHMMPPRNECRYCKRSATDLRAEQAQLLEEHPEWKR